MAAAATYEDRRAERDIVSFRTALDGPCGLRTAIFMVDISPYGFMSRTPASHTAGDMVTVRLPTIGMRAARIVWSLGGRIGGEFTDPIPAAIYRRMLDRAPVDRPSMADC